MVATVTPSSACAAACGMITQGFSNKDTTISVFLLVVLASLVLMQSYMIASNISLHLLSLSLYLSLYINIYTFPGFLKMALSRLSFWLNLVPQVMIHSNYAWAPATGEASVQDSCFKEFDVCRRHAGGHEVQSCPIWCFNLASVLVDEQRQCLVSRLEADSLLSFLTAIVSCSAARNCHVCFQGLRAGSLTLWSTPMTRRADWGSVSECSVLTNAQHCWQAEKCVCFVSSPNPKHSAGAQCEHLTTWEASKITFHADRNCMLDNRTLANWTGKGELCQTLPFPLPWSPWPPWPFPCKCLLVEPSLGVLQLAWIWAEASWATACAASTWVVLDPPTATRALAAVVWCSLCHQIASHPTNADEFLHSWAPHFVDLSVSKESWIAQPCHDPLDQSQELLEESLWLPT